ncbi:MAG: DAK2 domain-containing protein [Pseudonocardiaceae bacterium]
MGTPNHSDSTALPIPACVMNTEACSSTSSCGRAARTGAASTEELRARRGRSSYVGDVAVGVLDRGVTVALFFESARR